MTEIYSGNSRTVNLDLTGVTVDGAVAATFYVNDEPNTLTVTNNLDGTYSATITSSLTEQDGEHRLVWSYTSNGAPVTRTEWFDVVTPLAPLAIIREELEVPASTTDGRIILTERKVRRIIERVTGQNFGLQVETKYLTGTGERDLRLPARLHSITSITRNGLDLPLTGYELREDGKVLRMGTFNTGPESILGAVPIQYPWDDSQFRFPRGAEFKVTGEWGYPRVPQGVTEAALILIEQELCPETVYRERFIDNVASADFRFNLNSEAFAGTGNIVADQLLQDFIWQGAAIV